MCCIGQNKSSESLECKYRTSQITINANYYVCKLEMQIIMFAGKRIRQNKNALKKERSYYLERCDRVTYNEQTIYLKV